MKTLLASVGAFALLTGAAAAADLPVYQAEPAYVAPVAYDWTGFYVGAFAGYGWGETDFDASLTGLGLTGGDSASIDPSGVLVGVAAGYNQQFGNWVAGIEADIAWSDMDDDASYSLTNLAGASLNVKSELDWLATVRGRIGYAFDRALVYGTGGVAFGKVKNSVNLTDPAGASIASNRWSDTQVGWTIGAGVEYAVADNLSIKAEYLYVDLGDEDHSFTVPGGSASVNSDFDAHLVKVGVNYRF